MQHLFADSPEPIVGAPGTKGEPGREGAQGIKGDKGEVGSEGKTGQTGATGAKVLVHSTISLTYKCITPSLMTEHKH